MLGRCWETVDEHIRLRSDYSGVDEAQEEEASNQGADGIIRRFWVFALFGKKESQNINIQ